jgi:hypothetical protein
MSLQREVELKSDAGMDYSKLRDLLKAGKWKEADEETLRVMLAVAKREKEGYLTVEDIDNFPCADLRTIDQLWVKYSNGRFGFSVQKRIYQGLYGMIWYKAKQERIYLGLDRNEYDRKIWDDFGDKVGWRKGGSWLNYKNITFDKKAPEGHLPTRRYGELGNYRLFSRVETCRL